jgi:Notch-like protein
MILFVASVCSINTCQNGGTCRQIAPTIAECLCQTGFTGPTCSLGDSCTTLPCKNGGGCTTLLADTGTNWSAYRCVCPSGFYGQNCDTGNKKTTY